MLRVTDGVNQVALYFDAAKDNFSVTKSASFLVAIQTIAIVGIIYHSMAVCKQIFHKIASSLSLPISAPMSNNDLLNKHLRPLGHSVCTAFRAPVSCLQGNKGTILRNNAQKILPYSSNQGLLSLLKAHQGTILKGTLTIGAAFMAYRFLTSDKFLDLFQNVPKATSIPPDHSNIANLPLPEQDRLKNIWESAYAACERAHATFKGVTGKSLQCTIYRDSGATDADYASAADSINDKEFPGLSLWFKQNLFTSYEAHKRHVLPALFCEGGTATATYKLSEKLGQTHSVHLTWLEDAWPRFLRPIKTFMYGNDGCVSYQESKYCNMQEERHGCGTPKTIDDIKLFERP